MTGRCSNLAFVSPNDHVREIYWSGQEWPDLNDVSTLFPNWRRFVCLKAMICDERRLMREQAAVGREVVVDCPCDEKPGKLSKMKQKFTRTSEKQFEQSVLYCK
jgi:hypothetical protein